jgi:hypothetical protein
MHALDSSAGDATHPGAVAWCRGSFSCKVLVHGARFFGRLGTHTRCDASVGCSAVIRSGFLLACWSLKTKPPHGRDQATASTGSKPKKGAGAGPYSTPAWLPWQVSQRASDTLREELYRNANFDPCCVRCVVLELLIILGTPFVLGFGVGWTCSAQISKRRRRLEHEYYFQPPTSNRQ